jgi:hypothetical protein
MKTEVIRVTPKIAETLLANNPSNRSVSKTRVMQYAKSMSEGIWKMNGESIKLDKDGRLLDGQHRLLAIIESGMSLPLVIVKDLSTEVFDTIDTGKSRNGADVLHIKNVPNSINLSSGISLYILLFTGRFKTLRTSAPENQEILDEYNKTPDLYQSIAADGSAFYARTHRIISPSEYIGLYRYFTTEHPDTAVQSFFNAIEDRVGVAGLLNAKLLDNVISKRKMGRYERKALMIKAFNLFVSRANVKLLKFSKDESFPELYKEELTVQ